MALTLTSCDGRRYDYLLSTVTRGYSVLDDGPPVGSPLAGVIGALQRAYAAHAARAPASLPPGAQGHLPVRRTFNEACPLAALVI